MNRIILLSAIVMTVLVAVAGGVDVTKCRFCGSSSYGSGCPHSPYGKHQHRGIGAKCEFCGSGSYGNGCPHSQYGKHKHGGDGEKCVWCGGRSYGNGCPHSPTGKHER